MTVCVLYLRAPAAGTTTSTYSPRRNVRRRIHNFMNLFILSRMNFLPPWQPNCKGEYTNLALVLHCLEDGNLMAQLQRSTASQTHTVVVATTS